MDEAHRQRGLGRRLLADAIAHAPSLGLHTLVGLVFVGIMFAQIFQKRTGLVNFGDKDDQTATALSELEGDLLEAHRLGARLLFGHVVDAEELIVAEEELVHHCAP
mgnify:CR=1 FL=1